MTTAARDLDYPEKMESRGISNAQISSSGTQSEMHIAMQSEKLGSVELHARVTGEQVGADILVEKKEAHAALAVELPSLQQALSDKQLRVEHLWLTQGALHSSAGDSGNPAQQQPQRQTRTQQFRSPMESGFPSIQGATRGVNEIFDERGRLSVLA